MADPEARSAWVHANVDSDLQLIFQEAGMGEQIQNDLGEHYKTVRRVSSMADDRATLRTAFQTDFQMRPDSAANRAPKRLSYLLGNPPSLGSTTSVASYG